MKISNKVTYNALMKTGKQGWGDPFETFVKELANTLEADIEREGKMDAKIINKAIDTVQKEKMKFPISKDVQKQALILLSKSWGYGEGIRLLLEKGKI